MPIAACVDNIQITSANCKQPSNLQATMIGDSVLVTWQGNSTQYELEYKRHGTTRWRNYPNITSESIIVEGLEEGAYDFRVRGICEKSISAWGYLNSFVLYFPERHCFGMVDLTDTSFIIGTYGNTANPYEQIGIIDHGAESADSRHTIVWDTEGYDPRTAWNDDPGLKLVPPGKNSSIRLGNWINGGEAESLQFRYTVDKESTAILLLQYAVVLQEPGHDSIAQPRFVLEITNDKDSVLSYDCGHADFRAKSDVPGWHTANYGPYNYYNKVVWKDWTTLGVNLQDFDGQTINVRLTTYDCAWLGHYGYAYFTLDCAGANIRNISCATDTVITVQAPDGFDYEWTDYTGAVVSNNRNFEIAADDPNSYKCTLSYRENGNCYFELFTESDARFPIAEFDYEYAPAACRNRVRFNNNSHILFNRDGISEHRYNETCDDYEWHIGNDYILPDRNPVFDFPAEGGDFDVTLYSYIADGRCVDDTTITLHLPAISGNTYTLDTTLCAGGYMVFEGEYRTKEGHYETRYKDCMGCDSIRALDLHMHQLANIYAGDTTVCAEVPLIVDEQEYHQRKSGKFYRFYTDQYGCDSTIWMNVNMLDSILPVIQTNPATLVPNSGSITLSGTGYDYYTINGVKNGSLTGLSNGVFQLEFYNDFGCSVVDTVVVNNECLDVSLGEPSFVCAGDEQILLPYTVRAGLTDTYSLLFDTDAVDAGFENITDELMPKAYITIPLPIDVKPGYYNAKLVLRDTLCTNDTLPVHLAVHYPADLIFQRWDDVLSLRNTSTNGGYTFTAFQWYKNGEPIADATRSYYYADGGLDSDAEYQLELTDERGVTLRTCAFVPQAYNKAIKLFPNRLHRYENITISTPDNAQLDCYSLTGIKLFSSSLSEGDNTWNAKLREGIYIFNIHTETENASFHVVITH